jgi:hypothetical protein
MAIKGYRQLDENEVYAVNCVKDLGERIYSQILGLNALVDLDPRWVAIAETHLQQGLMALTRSITKPQGFA